VRGSCLPVLMSCVRTRRGRCHHREAAHSPQRGIEQRSIHPAIPQPSVKPSRFIEPTRGCASTNRIFPRQLEALEQVATRRNT
jgi:hypothetical protein